MTQPYRIEMYRRTGCDDSTYQRQMLNMSAVRGMVCAQGYPDLPSVRRAIEEIKAAIPEPDGVWPIAFDNRLKRTLDDWELNPPDCLVISIG